MIVAVSDTSVSAYNSYADLTEAESYVPLLSVTNQSIWNAATSAQQNAALVYATQFLDYTVEFPVSYERATTTQILEFPKKNVPLEGITALRRATQKSSRDYWYRSSDKYDNFLYKYDDNYVTHILSQLNQTSTITYFTETEVPYFMRDAAIELAIIHLDNGTLDDLSAEQIKRVKLDVIEVEYFANVVKSRGATIFQKLAKWGGSYNQNLTKPPTDEFRKAGKVGF